jgi:hypothetical protein
MTMFDLFAAIAAFWIGAPLSALVGSFAFPFFAVALAGLKVAGVVDYSWWWVALPIWALLGDVCGRMWIDSRSV